MKNLFEFVIVIIKFFKKEIFEYSCVGIETS